ncbi:MAG TPA: ADP-ribosylglycohydrolase family protein, partial [Patescibacteria group bacterium]|nr:ADP-ribosylglycohydrolase family protein [Patescibacteria group bacterium]
MITRKSRFMGSLMGVRIGDALGMPFEILTPEQILGITGRQGVTTFLDPQRHRTDAHAWTEKLKTLH